MQIERLVATWLALQSTSSRTKKRDAVSELLRDTAADDINHVVSYLSGELPHGKIGLGYAAVMEVQPAPVEASTLTLAELDSALTQIKATSGKGSKAIKQELLTSVLHAATTDEDDFLRRLLLGNLRQGALAGVMVEAVSAAAELPAPLVRRAAMMTGDLPHVAHQAMVGGADALAEFGLTLFTAVQPMLAQTASSVESALDKFGEPAAIEWKVDGARVQVHREGDHVRVFTRNLRDITTAVPDVVRAVQSLAVSSIILDGEAVSFGQDERPDSFQDTISRFASDGDGQLQVAFFDCLYLNGVDLIDASATERARAMRESLPDTLCIPRIETDDATVGQQFFDDAIEAGYEGVMVKSLDAPYEAGRRGSGWLKVKPVHTLDLVVLAVEWGSGRRQGTLSNIHLGARDDDTGEFVMLGKTFKGMTDEILAWQTERFLALETHRDRHIVYVRPEQVVEIAVDGIQRSTRYPGGVALRFARVKGYRSDKSAAEADSLATVRRLGRG